MHHLLVQEATASVTGNCLPCTQSACAATCRANSTSWKRSSLWLLPSAGDQPPALPASAVALPSSAKPQSAAKPAKPLAKPAEAGGLGTAAAAVPGGAPAKPPAKPRAKAADVDVAAGEGASPCAVMCRGFLPLGECCSCTCLPCQPCPCARTHTRVYPPSCVLVTPALACSDGQGAADACRGHPWQADHP